MKNSVSLTLFSERLTRLEDARAESQLACERQLVTEQTAALFRLTDFLAEGFAEYERRHRALSFDKKFQSIVDHVHQTPQEYGETIAPAFLEVLQYVALRRGMAHLDEILALP